ncbi:MAG TPA: UDPGP type 1 family protein [Candidatus Spyradenecus faecavium]|uniref:UDPGP type 1 family protein n=1 Tax=Candidatus Spyradenecus faecavium TaxID=2840947 RepID=A0A9D1NMC3_9BACT|nr:UDPGP type 1 family protein [Candidatus Spyradenecus faecavium]
MTFEEAKTLLDSNGQGHVLRFWDKLDAAGQAALLAQIATLDFAAIGRMQTMLKDAGKPAAAAGAFEPAPVEAPEGEAKAAYRAKGEELLRAGKVAALLVAGGQGSRLGYDGPKGAYPIGPISDRPLFWFHARKLLGLKKTYGAPVPFYVMTSETNDAATRAVFEANDYFGLDRADVFFFVQGMWPALDPEGKIILDKPGHIFMSPDGHGGTLAALDRSGALADMAKRGIEQVFFFQVDNPMVDIADPTFVGLNAAKGADMSLKVCKKRDAHEGMGVVVIRDGAYAMVEYSELSDEQMERTNPDGTLWLAYGSPAIHMFSRAFLQAEAERPMPLHLAHKKIAMVNDAGETVKPDKPNGYKFEKFIFDVIPNAKTLLTMAFDRTQEFSPVKNAEGNDSPATTKRDIQAKWRGWLAQAGVTLPEGVPVEIDPAFALDAAQLKAKGLLIG